MTDAEGNGYLDFFTGILTNMLGYDVPEVRDAVERQLATGVVHTSTAYLARPGRAGREDRPAVRHPGREGLLRQLRDGGQRGRRCWLAAYARRSDQVLAMRQSYHGRSFAAAGVTGNRAWTNLSFSPLDVHFLHGADRHLPQFAGMSDEQYIDACAQDLRHVLATATGPDVAALIAEPIQGVGGFTAPPDGLFAAYKNVLDESGILLISDEVQTGWGRTGQNFWGMANHGVTPDMMTFARPRERVRGRRRRRAR